MELRGALPPLACLHFDINSPFARRHRGRREVIALQSLHAAAKPAKAFFGRHFGRFASTAHCLFFAYLTVSRVRHLNGGYQSPVVPRRHSPLRRASPQCGHAVK